jgi:hypothetical protein
LLLDPASQVTRLQSVSSDVLAFIVSGGVTEVPSNIASAAGSAAPAPDAATLTRIVAGDGDPAAQSPPP